MNNSEVIELVRNALLISVMLSAPVVVSTAVAGVATGLVQVLTQIQDQTMQFLIKLIAAGVALLVTAGWMSGMIMNYTILIFGHIASVG
ncbi:type III secretion system export apparatus subunit SctS [Burkholderia sp. Bp8986]|uniref:type III secretion system export apparatus subunit SctS n=1 Tax=Burkholderia sp. Bp8986 TaxID=2184550 RepID=UPI000F59413E|nr:type III secretion system export apparatus subunit SctS [Burkholderia sp. Bp8986]RQS43253.1 EscS/YscS/HrcS family type III secretion system export apparatus protein [Burkholderia sp. Bp8986]